MLPPHTTCLQLSGDQFQVVAVWLSGNSLSAMIRHGPG